MSPKLFTLSVACVYTVSAVVGLGMAYAAGGSMPDHAGLAVGMLPLTPLHNLLHLVIGMGALVAYRNAAAATSVARGLALFLGFMAFIGLLPPGAASVHPAGLISTDGIWLHAVTALLAAYVGFAPMPRPRRVRGPVVVAA